MSKAVDEGSATPVSPNTEQREKSGRELSVGVAWQPTAVIDPSLEDSEIRLVRASSWTWAAPSWMMRASVLWGAAAVLVAGVIITLAAVWNRLAPAMSSNLLPWIAPILSAALATAALVTGIAARPSIARQNRRHHAILPTDIVNTSARSLFRHVCCARSALGHFGDSSFDHHLWTLALSLRDNAAEPSESLATQCREFAQACYTKAIELCLAAPPKAPTSDLIHLPSRDQIRWMATGAVTLDRHDDVRIRLRVQQATAASRPSSLLAKRLGVTLMISGLGLTISLSMLLTHSGTAHMAGVAVLVLVCVPAWLRHISDANLLADVSMIRAYLVINSFTGRRWRDFNLVYEHWWALCSRDESATYSQAHAPWALTMMILDPLFDPAATRRLAGIPSDDDENADLDPADLDPASWIRESEHALSERLTLTWWRHLSWKRVAKLLSIAGPAFVVWRIAAVTDYHSTDIWQVASSITLSDWLRVAIGTLIAWHPWTLMVAGGLAASIGGYLSSVVLYETGMESTRQGRDLMLGTLGAMIKFTVSAVGPLLPALVITIIGPPIVGAVTAVCLVGAVVTVSTMVPDQYRQLVAQDPARASRTIAVIRSRVDRVVRPIGMTLPFLGLLALMIGMIAAVQSDTPWVPRDCIRTTTAGHIAFRPGYALAVADRGWVVLDPATRHIQILDKNGTATAPSTACGL